MYTKNTLKTTAQNRMILSVCVFFALLLSAFNISNAQSVTIEKAIASGCYYYSGASKTTITVQIGWTGASSADHITITLDGTTTRTINPQSYYDPGSGSAVAGPIVTPQVVAFEINADGASHSLHAVMSGAHSASSATVNVSAPNACVPTACTGTELGGMVFYDNNADGVHQSGETKGIAGVTVTAFDKNGNTYTATSDANGKYVFSAANSNAIAAANFPVRVEFTNFPALVSANSGPSLTGNKSSVRFVASPSCSIDCGGVNPLYYSQSNPPVFTNLYTNGNPLGGGNAGTTPAIIEHSYTNSTDGSYVTIATSAQAGSVWAHSWNKFEKRLFSAATLKRHMGLGPLGLGGIYTTDYSNPSSPVFSQFIDVTTLGIDLGQSSVPSNSSRGLNASKTTPNADQAVYDLIGKVGIGGMDLSEDGNTLYFMNLYDNKVYAIDITNYLSSGTLPTAANVTSFAVPDPGCTGGQFHAYSVKVYEGKLYAGMVCDGSSSSASNLVATIKAMDLTSNTWSDVFSFPLTYPRGYGWGGTPQNTGWYPWQSTPTNFWNAGGTTYPTPILSDIEFDLDGSMVIALMDRTAHQTGARNYDNPSFNSVGNDGTEGGDVLRAFYSGGGYTLENNGKAGANVGAAPNNNQGPGFGEFYDDNFVAGGGFHTEMATGGLTLVPGSGEVMIAMVDPAVYFGHPVCANGPRRSSNSNGAPINGFNYYSDCSIYTFGKGNGMGDMEAASDVLSYLEIGNYVWYDVNGNGVQDPSETGIAGVVMSLYNSTTGALIKTTTTDANGNYYFSTLNGDNIQPNTNYCVLAGNATQYNNGTGLFTIGANVYQVSPSFNGQGANATLNDNNFSTSTLSTALGAMPAGLPKYCVTTGASGFVDHSIDLGLACIKPSAGANMTACGTDCKTLTGSTTTGTWSSQSGNPSGATLGSTTNGSAQVCFSATASGTFNFIFTNSLGCSDTMNIAVTPRGSIGNYVWNDNNNNGLQDDGNASGINGITVQLYKDDGTGNFVLTQTTTTANNGGNPGYYNFYICQSGDYKVKFPLTNSTGNGLTNQDTTPDTNGNSDADVTTGYSPVFTMTLTGSGTQVNNPTIDAGYLVCSKPNAGTDANVCGSSCYNLTGVYALSVGTWTAQTGNPSGATLGATNGSGVAMVCFANNASGAYRFIYTVTGGCSDTVVLTANPKPNAGADQTVCAGNTIHLSGLPPIGSWTALASNPAGGTLSSTVAGEATVTYTITAQGNYKYIYTVNGCSDTMNVKVVQPLNAIIGVSPMCVGSTSTYTNATTGGVWSSSNTAVATVSNAGVVSAVGAGSAVISYKVDSTTVCGCNIATFNLTVNATPTLAPIMGTTSVCTGAITTLTNASGGGNWSSSNNAIATVNSGGNVTGVSAGTATITYTASNGCGTSSQSATVTVGGLPMSSNTGNANMCVGSTTTLSNATAGGTWSSSNTAVATVNNSGVVTGVSAGNAVITYTVTAGSVCGNNTSSTTVNVNSTPTLAPVMGGGVVCTGSSITLTNASGGGSWSSSNNAIATINSGGNVTGVSAGTATITYTANNGCGSSSQSATVTVGGLPLTANTGNANMIIGSTTTLSNTTAGGTWSSSNTAVATVDNMGVVTAIAVGNAIITYTVAAGSVCGSNTATTNVNVFTTPTLAPVMGGGVVCVGSMITLTNASGGGNWSSSNNAIATVNSGGNVTGVSVGTATITYTVVYNYGGVVTTQTQSATVFVQQPIATTTGNANICLGNTTTLSNATAGGTWSSSNTAVATVNNAGVVTSVGAGSAVISYTVAGGSVCGSNISSVTVNVNTTPSLAPIMGTTSVCAGSLVTLTQSNGGGAWSSSNTSVATVNSGGNVSGISAGTTTISYTSNNGCGTATVNTTFTVNAIPSAPSISGSMIVCNGASTTLTASSSTGNQWYKNGAAIVGATGHTLTVNTPGMYTVTTTNGGSCASSSSAAAVVTSGVVAGFTINTNPQDIGGNNFIFTSTLPTVNNNYAWDFGDGTTSTVINPSISYTAPGTYTVKQIVTNTANGCVDSASQDAIVISCCVHSGGTAGLESKALGDVIATRLYGNAKNNKVEVDGITNGVKFNNSGVVVNGVNDINLNALMPATVAGAEVPYVSTPTDLISFTNAVEVLAVDYTKNSNIKAVAFGTKTLGDVYAHTKPICDRLKGAELVEVKTIVVNGYSLMAYKVRQRTGETEFAMNLSAGTATNRNSISLQSNWFTDSYVQDEKLYNFQLWAISYDMVKTMAQDIVTKLQANGTVNAVTTTDLPKAYISKGNRTSTNLNVTIQNNTAATTGYFELKEKANENSQVTTRQVTFTVNANGASNVTIPVKDNYEGNIYVYINNKLTDLVYLADGTWSLDYNKASTNISKFTVSNEASIVANNNELRLMRNVAVTGVSKDYISIYKTMLGGGLEQNVSNYKSIIFNANATGASSVKVTLIKKSIINFNEQYSYTMSLDGDKEYAVNLNQFKSSSNSNNIIANDITAVSFSFNNSRGVATTMTVDLSKVRFSTTATTVSTDNSLSTINIYPNPATTNFTATFNSDKNQSLVLKVIEVATGRVVKTQFVNATKGLNKQSITLSNSTTSGNYIVTLEGDDVKYNATKVMVEK